MKLQNLSLKYKIYFISVIVSILVMFTYTVINSIIFGNESEKMALSNGMSISKKKQKLIDSFFIGAKNNLLYIKNSKTFHDYIMKKDLKTKENLKEFLYHIMSIEKSYMQIRYIAKDGKEKVKVQRDTFESKPLKVKDIHLQDKSNRYYLKKIKNLKKDQFWFSNIDLNIEEGEIEIPFKPTIRVVYPIHKNDKIDGYIVINYFMDLFLNKLSKSPFFDVILCDNEGYSIVHYDEEKSWALQKKERYNIKDEFGEHYKNILTKKIYRTKKLISIKYDIPLEKGLIMVLQLKKDYIKSYQNKKFEELMFTSFLVLIISLIGSFILINIVQKVIIYKDEMIFEQNKLASMGQMIENIAHQWRQPLAQINSIIYTMDYEINKKDMDKKVLLKELDKIETVTTYLSQTINDFKEFLSINRKKEFFSINESIKKTISIVSASFEYYGINVTLNLKDDIKVFNYQNLFEQSILSILNNAKDALIQNRISEPNVTIYISKENNTIQVVILDNAGGIKTKPIDKIFEPYFSTKQHLKGTGLGLYISKMMIVDGMDGKIFVQNEQGGAKFKIVLDGEKDG
jgi:signal transduction histidine kinase